MYGAMYGANAPWLRRLPAVWRAVWPGEFKTGQGLVGQVSSSVVKQPPRALNNGVVVGVCRRSLSSWSRSSWSLSLSVPGVVVGTEPELLCLAGDFSEIKSTHW